VSRRVIITCPACYSADDVSADRAPDNAGFLYTCVNNRRHDDGRPAVWQADPEAGERSTALGDGVLSDLYEPLLATLRSGEPYLEHGIVEQRLREIAWDVFARHVDEAGHVAFGAIRNTASNRIGMALGQLRARGLVVDRRLPGTGSWSFNPDIGYWALAPAVPGVGVLTWLEYSHGLGRDPEFTDQDRLGLTSRRQGILEPWRPSTGSR
jgi:hypothetical protein